MLYSTTSGTLLSNLIQTTLICKIRGEICTVFDADASAVIGKSLLLFPLRFLTIKRTCLDAKTHLTGGIAVGHGRFARKVLHTFRFLH
jgi:hypothetical protein